MTEVVHIPFAELLGLEVVRFERDEADLALELRDELCNSWSVAHGGATMTLLDVAMAHAARSPDADGKVDPCGIVTIEMKTTFMQPGTGRLLARARRMHRTASLAFCEATVLGGDGKLVAQATGTFKFVRALAVGGKRIQRLNASD
ncbi:MAG TPA: PaaI family thioesterase [Caldimonas sp.]|nr:PaaI family thioesterase [Caldimonas sp.]